MIKFILLVISIAQGKNHLARPIIMKSPLSISPSQVRSEAVYNFSFSLSSFTPADAIISIIFPDNSVSFNTSSDYPCYYSRSDSPSSSGAFCVSDFSTREISIYNFFEDGIVNEGATSIFSIGFSEIINPKTTEITSAIVIKTYTNDRSLIDQSDLQDLNLKIQIKEAPMLSASIATDSKIIGANTTWIFSYSPFFESPIGSIISIEFPSWNEYLGASEFGIKEIIRTENPSCYGVTNINPLIACSWNSQNRTLSIFNGFVSSTAQGLVVFNVSSCYNPPRNTALSGFRFYLKSSNSGLYESSTNTISIFVAKPNIITIDESFTKIYTSQVQSQTYLGIQFFPSNPFLKDDIIELTLPPEISTVGNIFILRYSGIPSAPTLSQVSSNVIRILNGYSTYSNIEQVNILMYYFWAPSSTKPSGMFTVRHLTAILEVIDEGTGGEYQASPASIGRFGVNPYLISTNYTVKAAAIYYFEFSIHKVCAGGSIVIIFPPQIIIASRDSANCQYILIGLDLNATCFVQDNVLYIYDGFPEEYGGHIWFGIDQITNPYTSVTTDSFYIITYTDNSLAYKIDFINTQITFTATNDLSILYVTPQSLWASSSTSYVFTISTPFTIPANSKISIVFPTGISVSNTLNNCVTIFGLKMSSYSCIYSNNLLEIQNWLWESDPGTFCFYLTGVTNPFSTRKSEFFIVKIYDAFGKIVDFISTGSNFVQMLYPSSFSDIAVAMGDKTNGAITNYTVSITISNPIMERSIIIMVQPPSQVAFYSMPFCEAKTSNMISISCKISNASFNASLILSSDTLPSKAVLSFLLTNAKNPGSTQRSDSFFISTYTADGYLISQGWGGSVATTLAANIININITATNNGIGMKSNYTISYYPVNIHPSGSILKVIIPYEFSLWDVACIPITLSLRSSCTIFLNQVTLINGFDTNYNSSDKISFIITNITNPQKKIATSQWILTSLIMACQIDQSLSVTSSFACAFGCLTCDFLSTNCTSCYENYYLMIFSCLTWCPAEYVSNATARACTLCDPLSSFPYLYGNNCNRECPYGQWGKEGKCYDCINPCLTCKNSSYCTSCTQITTDPNIEVQTFLYPNNGSCLVECPFGTVANSLTFKCDPCNNCIPCPDGFYSTLGTNDCANLCDNSCEICSSKTQCLKCMNKSYYFDNVSCKPCASNFISNLDGKTCSHCPVNQYSNPGESSCSSACLGPSCEFCIKCNQDCRKCWNYYDLIPDNQSYTIVCLELDIKKQKFIVGQSSDEFKINANYSCPSILSKSMIDEITFTATQNANFKIIINPEYDIINNPPYFWIEFGGIPLNVSIDAAYDDFSLFIMNNENLIQQSYELNGKVLITLLGSIVFNKNLYFNKTYSCYSILSDITVSEMGGSSVNCYIQDWTTLIIIMDQWAAATNYLVFKNNVFANKYQLDATNLKFISLQIKNFNPPLPVPIINSASKICCGCNFTIDGSLSTGIGTLIYKWYIDDAFFSKESVIIFLARGCGSKSEIKVKLEISDLWNTEITQKIIKLEQVPLIVEIKHYDDITTHKYTTFSADIYWSSTTKSNTTFNIDWSYWPENDKAQMVTIKGQKELTAVFYDEVNYTISATAIPNNADFASDNETIYIIPAPDIPVLSIIGVNSSIYWAANISFYVDLVYSDGYKDRKYSINLSEIDCPYGSLSPGNRNGDFSFLGRENENYWCGFTVNVTFTSKIYKTIPCYFNVSKSKVPEVYVPYYLEYFDYSAPTRFMANIPDQTDLIINWAQTDNNPRINTITPKTQSSYTIDAFTLIPGLTYEFKIIAKNNLTNASTEVITKRPVNSPPQGGSFFITPNSGYALQTIFYAIFSGWTDPENNLPLSYQVFQQTDKGTVAISPKTFSNIFTLSIGSSGNIVLVGRIYDSLGTFKNLTFPAKVKAANKDSKGEADQLINNGLNIDQTMYISKIVAISKHTFEAFSNEYYTQNVISDLVDALNIWTSSKNISLNDVSASIDIISVFLNQSKIYDENLIANISWTLDNVLNKTPNLDLETYSVLLKQIDLLSARTFQLNSMENTSSNHLQFFEKFEKSFSEASTKYQITTNPNENSINYNGEFYNSTIISKNKKTLNEAVDLDKAGVTANFYADTSKDNDNTIYYQSLVSVTSIGNITSSLLSKSSSYATNIGSYSFQRDNGNAEFSDFIINQEYEYPKIISTIYIKPNVTKTTSNLNYRTYEQVNATNVTIFISPLLLDSDGDYSCQILDQSLGLFSPAKCKTKLNSDHSYSCECEFLNLISLIPSPDIYPVIKSLFGKIEFEIYKGFSWTTFSIFSLLTVIYFIFLWDLIRIDKVTHKPLKRKVKAIIAKIKNSIKIKIEFYKTRDNIDKSFEDLKNIIYEDVVKLLSSTKEKQFLPYLLTKKRIKKQANDTFIERDLSFIINCIKKKADSDTAVRRIENKLIAKNRSFRKFYYIMIKICRRKDQDKMLLNEIFNNLAMESDFEIEFTEELIGKIIDLLQNPSIFRRKNEDQEEQKEHDNQLEVIDHQQVFLCINDIKNKDGNDETIDNENRPNVLCKNAEINDSSYKYKSNYPRIFFSYLLRNIKSNFEPEHSFTYYFLKDNLVLGLIGFTNLNFSRKGRLTLLMVSLFLNCWLTILIFGSDYHFGNQEFYYGVSKLHAILYTFSFVVGLIVTIIAHFLPSNYLKEEFLTNKMFKSVSSRIFYNVSWLTMLILFVTGCSTASSLEWYGQAMLTKEIFINLLFAISNEAFAKPICGWCYKWLKYKLTPIFKIYISKINCCKKRFPELYERTIIPQFI